MPDAKETLQKLDPRKEDSAKQEASTPRDTIAERQDEQGSASESSRTEDGVEVFLNPALVGRGYDGATLSTGEEVTAGKKASVSKEALEDKTLDGHDVLVKADEA